MCIPYFLPDAAPQLPAHGTAGLLVMSSTDEWFLAHRVVAMCGVKLHTLFVSPKAAAANVAGLAVLRRRVAAAGDLLVAVEAADGFHQRSLKADQAGSVPSLERLGRAGPAEAQEMCAAAEAFGVDVALSAFLPGGAKGRRAFPSLATLAPGPEPGVWVFESFKGLGLEQ